MCRRRGGPKDRNGAYATSVMLLDCARLTHWRVEKSFDELFAFKRDYMPTGSRSSSSRRRRSG